MVYQDFTATLAQIRTQVGAIAYNADAIRRAYLASTHALVIFPECALSGYPPEDLLLHSHVMDEMEWHLQQLLEATQNQPHAMLVGTPVRRNGKLYNAALLVAEGTIQAEIYKHHLPNDSVFDERRIFTPGPLPQPVEYAGRKMGILICEDIWHADTVRNMQGAEVLIAINASPFEMEKHAQRVQSATRAVSITQSPLIYVNAIHAQDDLVFDGSSFVMSKEGKITTQLPCFEEAVQPADNTLALLLSPEENIYQAMMLGLREYVERNHFPGVVIGMSGGIDSALSAAIAVDALGKDPVTLITMPSRFSSDETMQDAKDAAFRLADNPMLTIPIEPMVESFHAQFPITGLAAENLQSRLRGMVLMAYSNQHGHMVLSTGNKSEMAVGYATLYGDMCGGYNVLKDVYKTQVFTLAKWRNANAPKGSKLPWLHIIPENIITKAPTAELRENQKDQDSLPPYDVLDGILHLLVEQRHSVQSVVDKGYSEETVQRVADMLQRAEYKRRQSCPGPKISSMPFTRDRRLPITNGWE